LLTTVAGYPADYSHWLRENLHLLNDISGKLIEEEGINSFELVRFSLITDFDYSNAL